MSGSDARQIIEEKLRRELFGPSGNEQSIGRPLDTNKKLVFQDPSECLGLFYDRDTGEEILTTEHPLQRYCAGVLYGSTRWSGRREATASSCSGSSDKLGVVSKILPILLISNQSNLNLKNLTN